MAGDQYGKQDPRRQYEQPAQGKGAKIEPLIPATMPEEKVESFGSRATSPAR
jgi:hypothetical protein